MRGVLKYLGHFYVFSVKHRKTLYVAKVLLLLLLHMYLPVRRNIHPCLRNSYILTYNHNKYHCTKNEVFH